MMIRYQINVNEDWPKCGFVKFAVLDDLPLAKHATELACKLLFPKVKSYWAMAPNDTTHQLTTDAVLTYWCMATVTPVDDCGSEKRGGDDG